MYVDYGCLKPASQFFFFTFSNAVGLQTERFKIPEGCESCNACYGIRGDFCFVFFSLGMKKDEKGATKTNKDHNVCLIVEVIDVRSTPVYLLPCRNDRWRHPWKLLCVLLERLFLFIVDLNIIIAKSGTVEIRVHWWSATSFFQPGSQFVSRFTFLIPRSKIVLNCSVTREEKKEEHAWVIKSILLLKGQKTNWFRISEPSANSNR